jgi:EAL domain-containing protein (putative c-di-GMP-specific phosphodiesterase class I)
VHYLQIDRSLVAGLCKDRDDSVVVEAVVLLAHTLGMKAVAEGVETLDQLGRLSDLGCDYAQGFYWSKAMLSEDARRMVSRALVQLAG